MDLNIATAWIYFRLQVRGLYQASWCLREEKSIKQLKTHFPQCNGTSLLNHSYSSRQSNHSSVMPGPVAVQQGMERHLASARVPDNCRQCIPGSTILTPALLPSFPAPCTVKGTGVRSDGHAVCKAVPEKGTIVSAMFNNPHYLLPVANSLLS